MGRRASGSVLRDRVAFDSPTESPDGFGGVDAGWTELGTRSAQFIYHRGGEGIESARLAGSSIYKVKVRQSPLTRDITAGWRMRDVLRGTVYNIREVDAVTDRAFVYLVVEGGVAV